jgi:hypothetical protein
MEGSETGKALIKSSQMTAPGGLIRSAAKKGSQRLGFYHPGETGL